MLVQHLYNSGFLLELENCNIIIDCISDVLPRNGKKLYVLVSHAHGDHYSEKIWNFAKSENLNTVYILSDDIKADPSYSKNIFYLKKGDVYKDEFIKVCAFGSTDVGISFFIEAEGQKIFHAGDLNNWHWNQESTPEESKAASAFYHKELDYIAEYIHHINFLFFPVDPKLGPDYMIGAEEFIRQVPTDYFIPMHFKNPEAANAFESIAKNLGVSFIRAGNGIFDSNL